MTDEIREAAIEAACVEFTRGDMPSWRRWEEDERNETREAMTRAIAAYERAMWTHGRCHFAARYDVGECCGNPDMCRHLPPEDEA
jgi:hypothetical protein